MESRKGRRLRYWLLASGAALVAFCAGLVALLPPAAPLPEPRHVAWPQVAAGPASQLRVYWVGHSLLNCRDERVPGSVDILHQVGRLAAASGVAYDFFDHTLYGTHLSLLWSGAEHASRRKEPRMLELRETLLRQGASFDALVFTEGLPIDHALELEHTAYYAQAFYCALVTRNPKARVYVSEGWSHLNASDPGGGYPAASVYAWGQRLADDRKYWERVADLAGTGAVPSPSRWARFKQLLKPEPEGCAPAEPIFLVPVGTIFLRLSEALQREAWPFAGRELRVSDLFANAYEGWPAGWPLAAPLAREAEQQALASLTKRYPHAELDDIHLSDFGVYVSSLVHYAVLYRRSPVGLPCAVQGVDAALAHRLQELVWQVLRAEPRTGIRD